MVSTRHVTNPQVQALAGRTSRYEQPVSPFTRMAMPTVASLSRPQNTTPTQSVPTRQPLGAPATLTAIARGVIGGGGNAGEVTQDLPAYSPSSPLRSLLDDRSVDKAFGIAKDRVTSGVVNATLAALLGADTSNVVKAGIHGTIPGPLALASLTGNAMVDAISKSKLEDAYEDILGDVPKEKLNTYAAVAAADIEDPTETFAPEEIGQYMATDAMLDQYDQMTRSIPSQFLSGIAELTPFKDDTLQAWDTPQVPREISELLDEFDRTFGDIFGRSDGPTSTGLSGGWDHGGFNRGDRDMGFGGGNGGRSGSGGGGYDASGRGGGIGNGPGGVGGIM